MSLRRSERIAKLYNNKPTYYKEILDEKKSVEIIKFVEEQPKKNFYPEKNRKKSQFFERLLLVSVLYFFAKYLQKVYLKY